MSAEQVESLWSGLFDNSGQPLSGGKVHTYLAGTSTLANLYETQDKTLAAGNPIVLDSFGRAVAYGDGSYKFVVDDAQDVTQYTIDNLTYGTAGAGAGGTGGSSHWGGPSAGSGNNFTINPFPAITSYVQGDRFTFIASSTNTGPVTLSVNGLAAIGIKRGPAASNLGPGDIQAGNIIDVIYDATGSCFLPTNGTDFLLHLNPTNEGLLSPATVLTQGAGFSLRPNSADGADSGFQQLGYGSDARGSYLILFGNEHANKGAALLTGGDVAGGGGVGIRTTGAQSITLATSNTGRWSVDASGHIVPAANNAYDIGSPANKVKDLHIAGRISGVSETWVPTITAIGAMTVTFLDLLHAEFQLIGGFVHFRLGFTFIAAGTASNFLYVTAPPGLGGVIDSVLWPCVVRNAGTQEIGAWRYDSTTGITIGRLNSADFTIGSITVAAQGMYKVD